MILIHQKHDKITMLWGKKWSCSRSLTYYIKCQTKSLRHKGTKNPGSAAKNSSVVIFQSHGGLLCFEKEQMPDATSIQNLYPCQRCCKSLWNVQGMKRLQKKKVLDLGFYSKQGHSWQASPTKPIALGLHSFSLPMASSITRKGDWIHELKCVEWLMHVPGSCDWLENSSDSMS